MFVEAGQQVAAGDRLAVLEAMKMEHTLTAARDGVVAEVLAAAGDQVEAGAALIRLEEEEEAARWRPVEIFEMGPRDGLQNERLIPTEDKIALWDMLSGAGCRGSRSPASSAGNGCRRWAMPRRSWPGSRGRTGSAMRC